MDLLDPAALVGTWWLERTIEDRRDENSTLTGVLELADEAPGRIRWEERATWHRSAGDVDVRRELRLVRASDGWWVRFDDGRDFHPWSPGEQVLHDCAPDTYRGLVRGTPERWTVVWEVSGPQKDYTMTTVLTPW